MSAHRNQRHHRAQAGRRENKRNSGVLLKIQVTGYSC
jgi:hypothetical protein